MLLLAVVLGDILLHSGLGCRDAGSFIFGLLSDGGDAAGGAAGGIVGVVVSALGLDVLEEGVDAGAEGDEEQDAMHEVRNESRIGKGRQDTYTRTASNPVFAPRVPEELLLALLFSSPPENAKGLALLLGAAPRL